MPCRSLDPPGCLFSPADLSELAFAGAVAEAHLGQGTPNSEAWAAAALRQGRWQWRPDCSDASNASQYEAFPVENPYFAFGSPQNDPFRNCGAIGRTDNGLLHTQRCSKHFRHICLYTCSQNQSTIPTKASSLNQVQVQRPSTTHLARHPSTHSPQTSATLSTGLTTHVASFASPLMPLASNGMSNGTSAEGHGSIIVPDNNLILLTALLPAIAALGTMAYCAILSFARWRAYYLLDKCPEDTPSPAMVGRRWTDASS
eukprot:TRINITY_DN41609_c0_g1_i1.p1 TRINITY_DN41609_c0_g1~~TRINITY_DN41609_c0_g1_i1.p1  ORF type:complete len:286 (+),score=29.34 TRINITY_DN41609_c0_g1_i1:85-858(+)